MLSFLSTSLLISCRSQPSSSSTGQAKDSGSSNSFHSQPLKQSLVQSQSQTQNSFLPNSNAPQGFSSKGLQDPHTLGDRDRDRDRGRRGEETSEVDEKVSTKLQVNKVETWHDMTYEEMSGQHFLPYPLYLILIISLLLLFLWHPLTLFSFVLIPTQWTHIIHMFTTHHIARNDLQSKPTWREESNENRTSAGGGAGRVYPP